MAKIVVLATGGTIAGSADDASDGISYRAAQLSVDALMQSVAGLADLLQGDTLQAAQVAQIDSKDMDFAVWQQLSLQCAQHLAQPDVRGVVITHGTDTLEETAFFLQLALPSAPNAASWQHKPVVLTCAMRPATARLSDGPQNLADAITLARQSQASGVLAVCAGSVHAAHTVQKIHPYRLDAFGSGDAGALGYVEEGHVRWLRPCAGWQAPAINASNTANSSTTTSDPCNAPCSALWQALAHTAPAQWPWVEVLHSQAGATPRAMLALADAGVRGMVLAGTGNATVHQALLEALPTITARGVAMLLSTRSNASQVVRDVQAHPASAHNAPITPNASIALARYGQTTLTPAKARVLLLLQLLAQAA